LLECRSAILILRILCSCARKYPDAPHLLALLAARHEWSRGYPTTE
jgi:hypothetical protein